MPACRSAAFEYRAPVKPASLQGRAFPWSALVPPATTRGASRVLSAAAASPPAGPCPPSAGACGFQFLSSLALRLVPTAPCHGQRPAVTSRNPTVLRFL